MTIGTNKSSIEELNKNIDDPNFISQNNHNFLQYSQADIVDAYKANDEQRQTYLDELNKLRDERDPSTNKFKRPWDFEIVQGFFKQSDNSTDDLQFDYIKENFGLIKPTWKSLIDEINNLNNDPAHSNLVTYKLIFCARHGQGWHNFAIDKYGIEAWDNYWSLLDGDGNLTWAPDPFLTPIGKSQAKSNNKAWLDQINNHNCPTPQAFYSSPFTRSCQTLIGTWENIVDLKNDSTCNPLIKEDLRETIGLHLCDKRSNKTTILNRFAKHGFKIEHNFQEQDVYYKSDWREPLYQQSLRINNFLNYLFEKDFDLAPSKKDVFISTTTHSGTIKAFLIASNHRNFAISTGGMIPILVKGTRRSDDL
ncbi:putative phosphomutase [Ascoidea rubescens DSM 1968]|uniref:Putative phosphomutase n=1 Tax=Ascoidea rubescens DSM 1968 TaxID=1344418 RepID=A0A1D2VLU1_9ASCO|nr:putative phosphomutase [Ascoidea rubescens DSM 1968]ODV62576.1 putative phosphomutase [Ascoidea rubescens DSM 1968]